MKLKGGNIMQLPKELENQIGTEVREGFILTGVAPVNKRGTKWLCHGLEKDSIEFTEKLIEEWKEASRKMARGEFGFYPGEPIGTFKQDPDKNKELLNLIRTWKR